MSQPISLKAAERKVFLTAINDGLTDIFVGCVFLMFAVVPLLSTRLGDFWGSMVFLPFWGLVYLAIWLLRKFVVLPRVGQVQFGQARKARLGKLTFVMLGINVVALILGILAAIFFSRVPGQLISLTFGLLLLAGFSLAAYSLDFNRLYVYGLFAGFAPPLGEWLYNSRLASHHGFPITFGAIAAGMILVGLILFLRLLRTYPLTLDGIPTEEA